MEEAIVSSVGQGGVNQFNDVQKVQRLLNKARPEWGGPLPKLSEDGKCGPLTKAAIAHFQSIQLSTLFPVDGRVDPRGATLRRLNDIANNPGKPLTPVNISVEPIRHEVQEDSMLCWAAAATMLVNARDRSAKEIKDVVAMADANNPFGNYAERCAKNIGLQPTEIDTFVKAVGLKIAAAVNFTVDGWASLMRRKGPLGVCSLTPQLHIRVVTQIIGDGSYFGTQALVHDPYQGRPYLETLPSFAQQYENVAKAGDLLFHQVWHR